MAFDLGEGIANIGNIWTNKIGQDQKEAQNKFLQQQAIAKLAMEQQQSSDMHTAAQQHAAMLLRQEWEQRAATHPNALFPTSSMQGLSPVDQSIIASPVAASPGSRIYTSPNANAPETVGAMPEGMSRLNLPESEKMRIAEKQADQRFNLAAFQQANTNQRATDKADLDTKLVGMRGDFALQVAGMRQPTEKYTTLTYEDPVTGNTVRERVTEAEAAARGPMKQPTSARAIQAQQSIADLESTSKQIESVLSTGKTANWSGTGIVSGNSVVRGAKHYLNMTDPNEEKLRADIGFLKSAIQHDLYGAAFTKQEAAQGNKFLFDIENNPTELPTRLKAYQDWLNLKIGEKKAAIPGNASHVSGGDVLDSGKAGAADNPLGLKF